MPEITNDVMYPLEKSTMIVDDVLNRLSIPLGCGWKGCEDVVHGVAPLPEGDAMQGWEMYLVIHDRAAQHPHRKLREC
jgi:hypothetical protein|tara:strand:+ start:365 stop:598 length:234 start_codon:yes stop_codon:yes gene_type:complete